MHIEKDDTSHPVRKLSCDHYHTQIEGVSICGKTQAELCKNVKRLFPSAECKTVEAAVIKDALEMGRIYQGKIARKQK